MAETPKRVWSNKKIVRQWKKQVWLKDDELKTYGKSWEEIDTDKPLEVYGNEWKELNGSDELEVYGNSEEEIWTVDDYTGGWDDWLIIDTSSMSMLVWWTGTRSFTYTPANADFSRITINSTFPDVATATLVKDSDWNWHVEVTAVAQLGWGTTIEITYLRVTQSFYVSVEVPIQAQSISNISSSNIIVGEWWSTTFTFDYLPTNANDLSNVSFSMGEDCYQVPYATANITSFENGTATVTLTWTSWSASTVPLNKITLNWVNVIDFDIEVWPYAEVEVSPAGWWTYALSKPLYVPYGGSIGFNNTDTTTDNPATADIYGNDTIIDSLTITATPEDWYKFDHFQSAIGSDWYNPEGGRTGIHCVFTPLS